MGIKKWWLINLALISANCLVLFLAAGTLQWFMAWLYALILLSIVVGTRLVLHPDLLIIRSMHHDGTIKWDLLTEPFVTIIGPLIVCLIAGLDQRFSWSWVNHQIILIALLLLLLGVLVILWAIKMNPYYSRTVRFQYERYPIIITDGPYRTVRHPGYTGSIAITLATPLILGSWIALIPSVFIVLGIIARTVLEDVTLQRQFKGYYNYTKKVPYRLIPGLW